MAEPAFRRHAAMRISQTFAGTGRGAQALRLPPGPYLLLRREGLVVNLELIRPGRPMEKRRVESFNCKFRLECLNAHAFRSLSEARDIVGGAQDYNTVQLHCSLGELAPEEFKIAINGEQQTGQR